MRTRDIISGLNKGAFNEVEKSVNLEVLKSRGVDTSAWEVKVDYKATVTEIMAEVEEKCYIEGDIVDIHSSAMYDSFNQKNRNVREGTKTQIILAMLLHTEKSMYRIAKKCKVGTPMVRKIKERYSVIR